jgi:hypothetical protein
MLQRVPKAKRAAAAAATAAVVGCPRCSFREDEVVSDVRRALLAW